MISRALFILLALLTAPPIIFCLFLMQPGPGWAAAAVLLASFIAAFGRNVDWRAPVELKPLAICLGLGFAVCIVAGHGHFLYQTDDWTIRDAVLVDLIRNDWPVSYIWQGHAPLTQMRAPLGMYLTPALIGKALGMRAGELALLAQNAVMLGLVLLVVWRSADDPRDRWIQVGLFVAFSGVDIIPWVVLWFQNASTAIYPHHIEIWNGHFEYPSHITQMIWAPNHALPGWAFVVAYDAWRRGRLPAASLAFVFAALLLWSPLVAMGAMPFLVFAGVKDLARRQVSPGGFVMAVASAVAVIPVAIYLTRGSAEVTQRWTTEEHGFLLMYVLFLAFEVGPFFALLARDPVTRAARGWDLADLGVLAATIATVPLYLIGGANDFAMRASIPALGLLALRASAALGRAWRRDRLRDQRWVLVALALSTVTPVVEMIRNVKRAPTPLSACNLVESHTLGPFIRPGEPLTPSLNYVADVDAFQPLLWLFRPAEGTAERLVRRACWPGRQFIFMEYE